MNRRIFALALAATAVACKEQPRSNADGTPALSYAGQDSLLKQKDSLIAEKTRQLSEQSAIIGDAATSARLISDIDKDLATVRVKTEEGERRRTSPRPKPTPRRKLETIQSKVRVLLSRLNASEARVRKMRQDELAHAKVDSEQVARLAEYERSIQDMKATVERQQAEIVSLTQRVDSLTGANTVLIARTTEMSAREDSVFVAIGSEKDLINRGLIKKEGGTKLMFGRGKTIVAARHLEPAQFQTISKLKDLTISLPDPNKTYRIVTRQDMHFAEPQDPEEGHGEGLAQDLRPERVLGRVEVPDSGRAVRIGNREQGTGNCDETETLGRCTLPRAFRISERLSFPVPGSPFPTSLLPHPLIHRSRRLRRESELRAGRGERERKNIEHREQQVLRPRAAMAVLARLDQRVVERLLSVRRELQRSTIGAVLLVGQSLDQRLDDALSRADHLIEQHGRHPVLARREREQHVRQLDRAVIAAVRLVVCRTQCVARATGEVVHERHAVRPARACVSWRRGVRRRRASATEVAGAARDPSSVARLRARALERHAHGAQHLRADTLLLGEDAEQQMLGADVVVTQQARLGHRELEHLLRARRVRQIRADVSGQRVRR